MTKNQLILTIIASLGLIGSFVFGCIMSPKGETKPVAAPNPVVAQAPQYPAGAKWKVEHRIFHRVYGANAQGDIVRYYYASQNPIPKDGFACFKDAQSGKWVYIFGGQITITEL